ncbi:MAG: M17 family peptidase N-terminal domain-containing protein [Myxococcota bacterium]|nr:M17 family peptidase N-terminal domain-containing protein [Myxococcota bacterium]
MTRDVQLDFTRRPVEAIAADVVVAGFFCDDRPLRGATGRLDWRLCGQISDLLASGCLDEEPGSAVLLPGSGPVKATRVLLLGLGKRREFSLDRAEEAMRDAIARCLDLGQQVIALSPLGIAPDDFARHAEVLIDGLSRAVREARPSEERENERELLLRISLSEKQFREAKERLPSLIADRSDPRISLNGEGRAPLRTGLSLDGDAAHTEKPHADPN